MLGLVGCFGFNGPLRQYFSLYRAVSQREGEREERIDESKNVQIGPCPTVIKIVGRPGTGSLPSTIAPPDHPPVLGRPTNLDYSRVSAYCACSRCEWGLFGHFFNHLSLLLSFSLSLGDGPI